MHEMSLALSLVETATEELAEDPDVAIRTVYVRIGALSGVVKETLARSFDVAAAGTPVDGAELVIEEMPAVVHCETCGVRVLPGIQQLSCPHCGGAAALVAGRELELTAFELVDEPQDCGSAIASAAQE